MQINRYVNPFTLRFDRSEYFDRAHVRGLGFLVRGAGVFGGYKTLTERAVKIIIHGGFEVKQMSATEREAFMSALLDRVLELQRKRKEVDDHAT